MEFVPPRSTLCVRPGALNFRYIILLNPHHGAGELYTIFEINSQINKGIPRLS